MHEAGVRTVDASRPDDNWLISWSSDSPREKACRCQCISSMNCMHSHTACHSSDENASCNISEVIATPSPEAHPSGQALGLSDSLDDLMKVNHVVCQDKLHGCKGVDHDDDKSARLECSDEPLRNSSHATSARVCPSGNIDATERGQRCPSGSECSRLVSSKGVHQTTRPGLLSRWHDTDVDFYIKSGLADYYGDVGPSSCEPSKYLRKRHYDDRYGDDGTPSCEPSN